MATSIKKRVGRKPKGDREAISCRVPSDHKPTYEDHAREAGMPLGDYVAVILAEHHGLPVPSYMRPANAEQGTLPISA